MAKKHVCCSFDYENDKAYYYLLTAWNSNPNIDFSVEDCTPSEIQSESVSKIKQVLSTKIGIKIVSDPYALRASFFESAFSKS